MKAKNLFAAARARGVAIKAAVVAASVGAAAGANAALPDWTANIGTDLTGTVSDMEGLVGPIILAVVVSIVVIKLFKRFTSKI